VLFREILNFYEVAMASLMFSVTEFCRDHGISRGMFYKLLGEGLGPKAVKIGRRTLISSEAAQEWRRRMEQVAAISGPRAA
jgi:predicted DNA-binding transcriptional regulator AlpA